MPAMEGRYWSNVLITLSSLVLCGIAVNLSHYDPVGECGYKACPKLDQNVLNIHIVAHSHMDVGWLKTPDQYFYGANSSIQNAGVQYILDSVLMSLMHDPTKRFVLVESAFLSQWFSQLNDADRHAVKRLLRQGQLEIAGGGWVMHDEAVTHYAAAINQMTLGHRFLNTSLGECARPLVAWQIDPFGHSQEHASLFAQMGLDGVFAGRISYYDKMMRKLTKQMEMVWEGNPSLGAESRLFGGVLYNSYSPPPGFCFDLLCGDEPVVDDPLSSEYNVDRRVKDFLEWAEFESKSYATNNVLVTMGNDFNYQAAEVWFKNLDKIINHANAASKKTKVFYSTPGCYLKAVNEASKTWSVKKDDFFPYASDPYTYWTGFYTSRPNIKYYTRLGNHFLHVLQQLSTLSREAMLDVTPLQRAVATMQHHDAVTGTERQHVADNYAKKLDKAWFDSKLGASDAIREISGFDKIVSDTSFHSTCPLLNISQCEVSETSDKFTVLAYNPLSRESDLLIRLPVASDQTQYTVTGPDGKPVVSQLVSLPYPLIHLPGRISQSTQALVFYANQLPAVGYKEYHISKGNATSTHRWHAGRSRMLKVQRNRTTNDDITIGNNNIQLSFDSSTGMLFKAKVGSVEMPMKQQIMFYRAMTGNNTEFKFRASGAYIFRPNGSIPSSLSDTAKIKVFRGPVVDEVHQQFSPWASQVVRICKTCSYAEFEWQVGPIPIRDNVGKEIISIFTTDIKSQGTFYTDANGRESILRTRNNSALEPVSGNYYPVVTHIELGEKSGKRLSILTDRAQGGSSAKDGQVELMVHRRLLYDDAFGVGEALNETAYGVGLVARGVHRLVLTESEKEWNPLYFRSLIQDMNHGPFLFFMPTNKTASEHTNSMKTQFSALVKSLPPQVNLLSLEPWNAGSFLLRLEHILPTSEGGKEVTVDLTSIFKPDVFKITSIRETTLSGIQWSDEVQRLKWNVQGESVEEPTQIMKEDVKADTIKLTPMQIRTFVVFAH